MSRYLSEELQNSIALYDKDDLTLGELAQSIWESLPEGDEREDDELYREVMNLVDEFGDDKPVAAFR